MKKWIHYDNPKCKKTYVKPGQPTNGNAIGKTEYGKAYRSEGRTYELLKPDGTISGKRYLQQFFKSKRAIAEKDVIFATGRVAIIFHHDNAHVERPVKLFRKQEILLHPP